MGKRSFHQRTFKRLSSEHGKTTGGRQIRTYFLPNSSMMDAFCVFRRCSVFELESERERCDKDEECDCVGSDPREKMVGCRLVPYGTKYFAKEGVDSSMTVDMVGWCCAVRSARII